MMRSARRIAATVGVLAGFLRGACAETQLAVHVAKRALERDDEAPSTPTGERVKVGRPYQVNGVWYYPQVQLGYDETGIASWYGMPFHGRQTANGERYDMNALTAAHKTLPLPSHVRVTNLENGRSIQLRVNDRGPFANGRIIDVSRRAAQLLGFQNAGTARVRVTLVADQGSGTAVAEKDMPALPQGTVVAEKLPPPPGSSAAPPPREKSPGLVRVADAAPRQAVAKDASPASGTVEIVPVKPTQIFVQTGAFLRYENAMRLRAQMASFGPAKISVATVQSQEFFRVRLGPMHSVDAADRMLNRVLDGGFKDAQIIVD